MTRSKWFCIVGVLAIVAWGMGCDNDSGGSDASVSGAWNGGGAYDQGTIISSFSLDLSQDGNSVFGSYSVTRTGRGTMSGSVNGSVSGSKIDMTLSPHGRADGSVDGSTMKLYWYESGFGGKGGGGNVTLTR